MFVIDSDIIVVSDNDVMAVIEFVFILIASQVDLVCYSLGLSCFGVYLNYIYIYMLLYCGCIK